MHSGTQESCWVWVNPEGSTTGDHLPRARAARSFYGGFTRNALPFSPSQDAPEGEQTLGSKTCVNVPPPCPIRRLPK